MKAISLCLGLMCLIFSTGVSSEAYAKNKIKRMSYGETVAAATASLINRHKTVGSFIRVFKAKVNSGEYRKFKKTLKLKGVSLKEKMPRARAVGNRILIAQAGKIKIHNAKKFSVNGKTFGVVQKSLSARFDMIYSNIAPKKKRSKVSQILFPEAHAFGNMMGLIATIGTGLAGYHFGPKLLGVSGTTGALLGVGGLYLATELWQSFKSGDITCTDDGRYQKRSKGRNAFFMAKAEQTVIPTENLPEGLSETCTKNSAADLKAWAEQDPLTTKRRDTASESGSSRALYGE